MLNNVRTVDDARRLAEAMLRSREAEGAKDAREVLDRYVGRLSPRQERRSGGLGPRNTQALYENNRGQPSPNAAATTPRHSQKQPINSNKVSIFDQSQLRSFVDYVVEPYNEPVEQPYHEPLAVREPLQGSANLVQQRLQEMQNLQASRCTLLEEQKRIRDEIDTIKGQTQVLRSTIQSFDQFARPVTPREHSGRFEQPAQGMYSFRPQEAPLFPLKRYSEREPGNVSPKRAGTQQPADYLHQEYTQQPKGRYQPPSYVQPSIPSYEEPPRELDLPRSASPLKVELRKSSPQRRPAAYGTWEDVERRANLPSTRPPSPPTIVVDKASDGKLHVSPAPPTQSAAMSISYASPLPSMMPSNISGKPPGTFAASDPPASAPETQQSVPGDVLKELQALRSELSSTKTRVEDLEKELKEKNERVSPVPMPTPFPAGQVVTKVDATSPNVSSPRDERSTLKDIMEQVDAKHNQQLQDLQTLLKTKDDMYYQSNITAPSQNLSQNNQSQFGRTGSEGTMPPASENKKEDDLLQDVLQMTEGIEALKPTFSKPRTSPLPSADEGNPKASTSDAKHKSTVSPARIGGGWSAPGSTAAYRSEPQAQAQAQPQPQPQHLALSLSNIQDRSRPDMEGPAAPAPTPLLPNNLESWGDSKSGS